MIDINAMLQTAVEAAVTKLLEPIRHDISILDEAVGRMSHKLASLAGQQFPTGSIEKLADDLAEVKRILALVTDGTVTADTWLALSPAMTSAVVHIAESCAEEVLKGHTDYWDHNQFLNDESDDAVRRMMHGEVADTVERELSDIGSSRGFADAVIRAIEHNEDQFGEAVLGVIANKSFTIQAE